MKFGVIGFAPPEQFGFVATRCIFGAEGAETLKNVYIWTPKHSKIDISGAEDAATLSFFSLPKAPKRLKIDTFRAPKCDTKPSNIDAFSAPKAPKRSKIDRFTAPKAPKRSTNDAVSALRAPER